MSNEFDPPEDNQSDISDKQPDASDKQNDTYANTDSAELSGFAKFLDPEWSNSGADFSGPENPDLKLFLDYSWPLTMYKEMRRLLRIITKLNKLIGTCEEIEKTSNPEGVRQLFSDLRKWTESSFWNNIYSQIHSDMVDELPMTDEYGIPEDLVGFPDSRKSLYRYANQAYQEILSYVDKVFAHQEIHDDLGNFNELSIANKDILARDYIEYISQLAFDAARHFQAVKEFRKTQDEKEKENSEAPLGNSKQQFPEQALNNPGIPSEQGPATVSEKASEENDNINNQKREIKEAHIANVLREKYSAGEKISRHQIAKETGINFSFIARSAAWKKRECIKGEAQLQAGPTAKDSGLDIEIAEGMDTKLATRPADLLNAEFEDVDLDSLTAELAKIGEKDIDQLLARLNKADSDIKNAAMDTAKNYLRNNNPSKAATVLADTARTV